MLATVPLSSPLKFKSSPWGSEWELTPTCGNYCPPPSSHTKPTSRGRAIVWGDGGMEMEGQRSLTWLLQEKNERVLDGLRLGGPRKSKETHADGVSSRLPPQQGWAEHYFQCLRFVASQQLQATFTHRYPSSIFASAQQDRKGGTGSRRERVGWQSRVQTCHPVLVRTPLRISSFPLSSLLFGSED